MLAAKLAEKIGDEPGGNKQQQYAKNLIQPAATLLISS